MKRHTGLLLSVVSGLVGGWLWLFRHAALAKENFVRTVVDQQSPHSSTDQPDSLLLVIGLMTLAILGFEFYLRIAQRESVANNPTF